MKNLIFVLIFPFYVCTGQSITLEPIDGIELNDQNQSIQYSDNSVVDNTMIYMFKNKFSNPNKMVISHSPIASKWGLQYNDEEDIFVFRSFSSPAMSINLVTSNVNMHKGVVIEDSLTVIGVTKMEGNLIANSIEATTLDAFSVVSSNFTLNNGGNAHDFLVKSNSSGEVTNKKGNNRVAIHYIISVEGTYPTRNSISKGNNETFGVDPFIGEITMFAGNFEPDGWAFCNGQLLDIDLYPALFSILGTAYGGNGLSTFALPDLRAGTPIHSGSRNGITWSLGEKD